MWLWGLVSKTHRGWVAQSQSPACPGVLCSWLWSHSQTLRLLKLELLAMHYIFQVPVTCFGGFAPSRFLVTICFQ